MAEDPVDQPPLFALVEPMDRTAERKAFSRKTREVSARLRLFLDKRHVEPCFGKKCGGRQARDPGAYNDDVAFGR
jgi:hypothetical protein